MVKFNQRLHANVVPGWADDYVDYGLLKRVIHDLESRGDAPSPDLTTALLSQVEAPEGVGQLNAFVQALLQEADKVERFYARLMKDAKSEWEVYRLRLHALGPDSLKGTPKVRNADHEDTPRDRLQSNVRDLYRTLTHLRNFCIVNYTGFVKITKKYTKQATGVERRAEDVALCMRYVHKCEFSGDAGNAFSALDELVGEVERAYALAFCGGKVEEARFRLLTRRWKPTDWRTFKRGLNIGIMLQLMLWVTWVVFMESNILRSPTWQQVHTSSKWMVLQLPVYRGIGCATLALWCWGACLYCWNRGRVHWIYIFEFDERQALRHSEVFDWATSWTQWFLLNFLLFYKSLHGVNPMPVRATLFPLLLCLSAIGVVGCTSPLRSAFMLQTARRIVSAPFGAVAFWDAFAADGLTSLVQPMSDLAYSACYFGSGEWLQPHELQGACGQSTAAKTIVMPLIAALPLWWRLCQNLQRYNATHCRFPWLLNALKYGTSLTVVVFGVFHPQMQMRGELTLYRAAYFCAFVGSTLFSFSWDVLMDWQLLELHWEPRELGALGRRWCARWPRARLRQRRMYSPTALYWGAITIDFFLRFMWTTTLIPSERMLRQMPTFFPLISPFTAAAEVCRRAMWSVFRVESEHLHSEGFRRVQLVPLHFDDASTRRESSEAYVSQQRRSRLLVITEIVVFAIIVVALATTAILTRTTRRTIPSSP